MPPVNSRPTQSLSHICVLFPALLYAATASAGTFSVSEQDNHAFSCGNDGNDPNSGLVFDSAGNLYGTA